MGTRSVSGLAPIQSGFTLVELVIVVAIFGAFALAVVFSFNPISQINKAKDSVRQSDINEIRNGIEVYYQDNNCLPQATDFATVIASRGEWSANSGKTVYMKKVPLDPNNTSYIYKGDSSDCPQWGVIFAKLSKASKTVKTCPLLYKAATCAPQGFDDTWACVTIGTLDCDELLGTSIVVPTPGLPSTPTPTQAQPSATPTPTSAPGPTATPTQTPTPTFTPTPTIPCSKNWRCTGTPLRCNVVPAGTGDYCNSTCAGAC